MSIFSKKPQAAQQSPTSTAAPTPATPPWYASVLAGVANTAVTIILGHYFGPAAGIAGAGLGTVAAFHHQIKK